LLFKHLKIHNNNNNNNNNNNMHAANTLLPLSLLLECIAAFVVPQSFTFTTLSYDLGVRHIHTPEFAIESHGLTAPGFSILSTQPPDVIAEYAIIRFTYATLIDHGNGAMFTCNKDLSHVMLASNSRHYNMHLFATFEVQQNVLRHTRGHTLRVSPTLLLPMHQLEQILCPQVVKQLAIEEAIARGYAKHAHEDPNLLAYRQMVLFGNSGNKKRVF